MTGRGKLLLLGTLYFSQGLPFGFFTQGLPVILRHKGYSLGAIGMSSLLAAPWALKWLWAPIVDRTYWPRVGRRKSWIVPLQLLTIAVLLALSLLSTAVPTSWLLGAILLLNLLAATQDIATDGLAVELLARGERGLANGLQVAGYRLGMILGGGALLILHHRLGDTGTFAAMAALTAVATLPVLRAHEPSVSPEPSTKASVAHWLRRPGSPRILGLLVVYKLGDAFATGMLRPFLVDSGLSLTDIGWLLGTVGFVAGMMGAMVGGALVNRLGRKPALIGFGFLQALSVAGYAYLAIAELRGVSLYALCGAEHFASGMATAALFTCMMDWSSEHTGGADVAVQASAVVIATGAAGAVAGFSAQALGYFGHFGLATVLAFAALYVAGRCFP